MKQFLTLIMTTIIMVTSVQLYAQEVDYNNNISYSDVIPGLTSIETDMKFSDSDVRMNTLHTVEEKKGKKIHTIISRRVDHDTLRKYLGDDALYKIDSTYYYEDDTPLIDSLVIMARELYLNDGTLWLPGCNIGIYADQIGRPEKLFAGDVGNITISADALPPRTSVEKYVESDLLKGVDGTDAGNITSKVGYIDNHSRGYFVMSSKGADGGCVYFPKITYKDPKTRSPAKDRKFYKCQDNGEPGGTTTTTYYPTNCQIVACVFTNPDCEAKFGYQVFDDDFEVVETTNDAGKSAKDFFRDKEKNRFQWKDATPGKAGNNGKILLEANNWSLFYSVTSCSGNEGAYYNRNVGSNYYIDDPYIGNALNFDVNHKGQVIRMKDLKLSDYCALMVNNYTKWDGLSKILHVDYIKEHNYTVEEKAGVGWKTLKDKYGNYEYKETACQEELFGILPDTIMQLTPYLQCRATTYLTPYLLCEFVANTVKNEYRDKNRTESQDNRVKEDIKWLNNVIASYKKVIKQKYDNGKKGPFYEEAILEKLNNIMNELDLIASDRFAERDIYGNLPGYRPVLSFRTIMSYWKENIRDDLYLYAVASEGLKEETQRESFINNLGSMKTMLKQKIKDGKVNMDKAQDKIDGLKTKARDLSYQIDSLNRALKAKEEKLMERAKTESDNEKKWRIGLKVLSTAAAGAATYFGGPEAGQLAFSLTDQISSASIDAAYPDADLSKGNIVNSVIQDLDIKGTYAAIRDKTYKPTYTKSELNKRKEYSNFDLAFNLPVEEDFEQNKIAYTVPPAKKYYLEYKEEYDKQMKKEKELQAYAALASNAIKDVSSVTVSSDYMSKAINRIVKNSPELARIAKNVKWCAKKNGECMTEFTEALSDKNKYMLSVYDNTEKLYHLKLIDADKDKYYDPIIKSKLIGMKDQALERLKWMEYQLVKIYNYTTLEKYEGKMTNFRNLLSSRMQSEPDTAQMKAGYAASLQNIKFKIIESATNGHYQDETGRSVVLKSEKIMDNLNRDNSVVIDLQADLKDEIIRPDENNNRIIEINLVKIVLEKDGEEYTLGEDEEVRVTATLGDKGVLRKNNDFFLFFNDSNSSDAWSWTWGEGNKSIGKTIPSKNYNEIISFITDNKKTTTLFTNPPAWNKLRIGLDKKKQPKGVTIKSLKFEVVCDFETLDREANGLLDVRMAKDLGQSYIIINDSNGLDTIMNNRYSTLAPNTNVSLEAVSLDTTKMFAYWEVYPDNVFANQDALHESKISFTMPKVNGVPVNVRIEPVYKENSSGLLASSGERMPFMDILNYNPDTQKMEPVSQGTKDVILSKYECAPSSDHPGYHEVVSDFEVHYVKSTELE